MWLSLFFFFKQKTAYEMRISDWSSDVCSSDLLWLWDPRWPELVHPHAGAIDTPLPRPKQFVDIMLGSMAPWCVPHAGRNIDRFDEYPVESTRSEERRVGKEWVSTCRSRG